MSVPDKEKRKEYNDRWLSKPGNKERKNEYRKQRRKYLIANKLCLDCVQPVESGSMYCQKHGQSKRDAANKRAKRKKEEGICLKCSALALEGLTHCEKCRKIVNERNYHARTSLERRFEEAKYFAKRRLQKRMAVYWDLSFDDFVKLQQGFPCHYCDLPFVMRRGVGLDRIDNDKGYTKDNVVPCCLLCNRTRGDHLSYTEMKQLGLSMRRIRIVREGLIDPRLPTDAELNDIHHYGAAPV